MSTATDLNHAADLLEQDGWTQNTLQDNDGCLCALGAIQKATLGQCLVPDFPMYGPDEYYTYYTTLGEINRYVVNIYGYNIVAYNDIKGRTAAEVIALFREVARKYEDE